MRSTDVHATAVVHPSATLGEGVHVGPYCVIGAGVEIGDSSRLASHVVVEGPTRVGSDNVFYSMSSIGCAPQDLKYKGEPTRLEIGSRNRIREFVTVSRGTVGGGGVTLIGDGNLMMAQTHIAHDCTVGSEIIFANAATLAGHVEVGDRATIGAYSGVHQFCRVAREAFIGGYTVVTQDALPWVLTVGNRATSHGVNSMGLKRRGYSAEVIRAVKKCYAILFRSKLRLEEATARVEEELGEYEEIRYFVEFVRTSKRGICR